MKRCVLLLLFVALLLPFRGALAVTGMLCHQGLPLTSLVTTQPSIGEHEVGVHQHVHHGTGHDGGHHDGQAPDQTASCDLCLSICGAPPFPAGVVMLPGLLPCGAERFPAIAPPHAEFALGGLERPPRTI